MVKSMGSDSIDSFAMSRERQIQPALTVDENQSSLTPSILPLILYLEPYFFFASFLAFSRIF